MSRIREFVFPVERKEQRLDTFLAESLPELSRSQLKKLIDNGAVLLDGTRAKAARPLKGGETIRVSIPEAEPVSAAPEAIPLKILYEDRDLVVIDKPAGMVVHPAAGHHGGTLVNALLHHCDDLAGIGGELRPGIVHRLDKDTSGILVVSKNDACHQHLAAQFKEHSVRRRYLALIHGCPERSAGTIDQPIGRHPVQRKKMSGKARRGKRAVTHWRVLERYPGQRLSLVELRLETGRTHQIRVHFAETGHPLVGDPLYGRRNSTGAIQDPRLRALIRQLPGQALHAASLGFVHPRSGKYLEFSGEMPDTLKAILDYLSPETEPGARA